MSDKEILVMAESMLHEGQNSPSREGAKNYTQASIAASLLVIARNSCEQIRLADETLLRKVHGEI